MTINKQLDDWKEITEKYQEYKRYEFVDCDDRDNCVQTIQDLIKHYVVNYGVCYDPANKPCGEGLLDE